MSATEKFKIDLVAMLPRLNRYARNLTRSNAEANDLVQATCARILDRWAQFRPGSDFDRWAFTVMSSVSRNRQRADNIRRGSGLVDAYAELTSPETPEHTTAREDVFTMLGTLPEEQGQVITLVYIEGYTYQETAEILNIPIGTVMSRIARGRARLSQAILLADSQTVTRAENQVNTLAESPRTVSHD